MEATYPKERRAARTQDFQLLGVLPEEADWIDALAGFEFAQRIAASEIPGNAGIIAKLEIELQKELKSIGLNEERLPKAHENQE